MGFYKTLRPYLILVGLLGLLLYIFSRIGPQYYLVMSFVFMFLISAPFIYAFSKNELSTRELVMLALLGAIAAISRLPFAAIPSLQPSSFVIIVSGMVLGPQSGFVVGALTALVSNFFLGQGPWTPWQIFFWGLMGLVAGLFSKSWWMKNLYGRCLYGLIAGVLFGWGMNLWVIIGLGQVFSWSNFIVYNTASLPFDLTHGLGNVFFLYFFSPHWIRILNRFKDKYGLFQKSA